MVREVLTVNIGQCGIQLGETVWRQYCAEHDIGPRGKKKKSISDYDNTFLSFFEETGAGQFFPRNLMVDLEPSIIDNVQNSNFYCHRGEFLVSSQQDAGKNFAQGHYALGSQIIDKVNDRLRKLVDNCDNVQGFVINHSVGGGTGSGLGSLILERIAIDYRKKSKLGYEVYPFNNNNMLTDCPMEVYNALLATHWLLDHTEVSFMCDNRRIYDLCENYLNITSPSYKDMNLLFAKLESASTLSLRNEGELNVDLSEFQTSIATSLVPFPRLHFITPSVAPLISHSDVNVVYDKTPYSKILMDGYVRKHYYYPLNANVSSLQYVSPFYAELMNLIYIRYTDVYKLNQCDNIKHKDVKKYSLNSMNSTRNISEMCFDPNFFMVEIEDFDVEKDKYMAISINYTGAVKAFEANAIARWLKRNNKVRFVEWCPTGTKIGMNDYVIPPIDGDTLISKSAMVAMASNNTGISKYFRQRITDKFDMMYAKKEYVHLYTEAGMEVGEFEEAREDLGFLDSDYLDVLSEQATDESDDDSD